MNDIVDCLLKDAVDVKSISFNFDKMQDRNKMTDIAGRLNKIAQDLKKLSGSK